MSRPVRTAPFLACLMAGVMLVGACGLDSATSAKAQPSPTPRPSLPPGGTSAPLNARELVNAAQRAFFSLPGYQTDLHFFQKKGAKTSRGVYQITGKPNHQMKIVIEQGEGSGTKLFWNGTKTVKVRPSGLLGALVVDLDLHDEKIMSIRGYSLDQIELSNLLGMLNDPQAKLLSAGKTEGGYRLLISSQRLLSGCATLDISFDAGTFLPKTIQMSDGREVVFGLELRNLRPTSHVSFDI